MTVRNTTTAGDTRPARRQRNVASLVGGVVIAMGCFALWLLVAAELTQWPPNAGAFASGLAVALGVGIWIRLADL